MSAGEAADTAKSGLSMGTLVRIAAILLGIGSATLLAHSAFGIRFNEDFLLFLKLIENTVGALVLPFELLLVNPVANFLHERGFAFQLYSHWHHAFALLWLFFAAQKRATAPLPLPLRAGERAVTSLLRWSSATVCALIAGTLAGTVTLDHPAVLWWPVVGYFVYDGLDSLILASRGKPWIAKFGLVSLTLSVPFVLLALGLSLPQVSAHQPPLFWLPVAAFFTDKTISTAVVVAQGIRPHSYTALLPLVAITTMLLAVGALDSPAVLDFRQSPSPGLANLCAFVLTIALWYLVSTFLRPLKGNTFDDPFMRTALDVLAVLGGAATITYLGQL